MMSDSDANSRANGRIREKATSVSKSHFFMPPGWSVIFWSCSYDA